MRIFHHPLSPQVGLAPVLIVLSACQGGYAGQISSSREGEATQGTSRPNADGGAGTPLFIDGNTSQALAAMAPRVAVMRRLNRVEYNNTVRDLFGTALTPADNFVADELTGGFDTVGSTLQMSPTLVLGYLTAAEALSEEATNPATSHVLADTTCAAGVSAPDCLKRLLALWAERAWRRPVTAEEVAQLAATAGASQDSAMVAQLRLGLTAVLMSPHFLYHVELDAQPAGDQAGDLSDVELASRLSYLLWSSMPDAQLMNAAKAGTLHDDTVLGQQVDRMLADERSYTLVNHFAGFWLGLNRAAQFVPNAEKYPALTPAIREAMITQSEMSLRDYVLGSRPIATMLDATDTYLNGPLASYYGLPAVAGDAFVRVALPQGGDTPRRGLLTQGAWLMGSSDPDATNLIRRGKNVLNAVLCTSVGAPPAGAGNLPSAALSPNQTQRQRLEAHIVDPSCASCHNLMDPIGYALERFGPDGRVRATDNGSQIDSSGVFQTNPFTGAHDFAQLLARAPSVNRCAAKTFYTYALGLVPTDDDRAAIDGLTALYVAAGGKMRDLIKLTALSRPFRARRAQGGAS